MLNGWISISVLSLGTALAMGCGGPEEPPRCPEWGCGTNAASLYGNVFHELDASGKMRNGVHVELRGFRDGHDADLQLEVDGDRLLGRTTTGGVLEGPELVGATLQLIQFDDDDGGNLVARYVLRIVSVAETDFWIDPGERFPVYQLMYRAEEDQGHWLPLCRATDEVSGLREVALIFRGDRYDATTKTVTEMGPDDTWFNVACVGSATAKMHLLRHTAASSDETHKTSIDQRQAMLKMLTADYCGTGEAFTKDGYPLLVAFDQDWQLVGRRATPNAEPVAIEAIWTANGAVCLNSPRVHERSYIDLECQQASRAPLADCPAIPWSTPWPGERPWRQLGYAMSATDVPRTP